MDKYVIGVDFGTLSGRVLIVNTTNGEEITTSEFIYPNAVMDMKLADGTKLGVDWALQDPSDYLKVLSTAIPDAIDKAGIDPEYIIGIGIDFTSCTILPVFNDGTPLCFSERYKSEPHAWVKLWKHHAAQPEANIINERAMERDESFLSRYGGKVSSEWLIPKLWQILNEAPEIYNEADKFIEAGDWIIWQLTGEEKRNSCAAGYKGMWSKKNAYPSNEFLSTLHPALGNLVQEKLSEDIYPVGTRAGSITERAAELSGLKPGTAVAVAIIDAHASFPAAGITTPGKMLAMIGTSTCHLILDSEEKIIPGISGVVEDGIIEGYYAYEAGQACGGDHFQWVVDNCVSAPYVEEAISKGITIHELLTEKASVLEPGESGMLALDWWNGNRSVLVDGDLSGLILGAGLDTHPEEIYRTLVEATAFGTKMIIDTFEENGVEINEFFAAGGIAEKNAFIMQVYADVINREIKISGSPQAAALGSAMFGAVAAGAAVGGFDSISDAAIIMGKLKDKTYIPRPDKVAVYKKLYKEYQILHDYFGRGANNVMKRLKDIKKEIRNA